jgi:hypothetical protein
VRRGLAQDRKRSRLLKCKEVHWCQSAPLHRVANQKVVSKTEAFSSFFFISFLTKNDLLFFITNVSGIHKRAQNPQKRNERQKPEKRAEKVMQDRVCLISGNSLRNKALPFFRGAK